ncbi:unnamed protein product (macronuclear) [Paramecium tetraurelia]|uniref:HTH psq-type domain-containing protein n=1 Tax=Paramecium tetraurelia TaxID=5888 RepID=A0D2E4_PARTE|nr:uncharacterized protein GSPATT00012718001 [Paramecium tetraurelia]CAK77211.1 unnamed protein product [Paramecium tetraurelia]|eukprot:XP_001444608.1 hypothetical protein (macronuclear) [Paramecium tetraurelia strain d4-2]
MNIQTQSEIELKLSAFEKLGDNPTEVDIKYVSYLFKIPLQTIRQWLEERAGEDFQIDLSPADDKECSIIGMKKKNIINSQSQVKEEEAQQKQIKNQSIKSQTEVKQNQDAKKKKQIDKIKQSDPNKKAQKTFKKQAKLAAIQAQYSTFEDCKTQDKNVINNQNLKLPLSIQTQKLVQQIDISNKINNIVQNIDNRNQLQQQQSYLIRKEAKQNKLLSQKKKLIRLEKEKHQKDMNAQFNQQNSQSKGQQKQCIIIIDDEINQKSQLSTNPNKEIIYYNYYSTQTQYKQHINEKLQLLQDLSYFQDKKIKKPIMQALQEIQLGQYKQSEYNIAKQNDQRQNKMITNQQKNHQQSQAYPLINQTQIQKFSVQNNEQIPKSKQQNEKNPLNTEPQNLNQQSLKSNSNVSQESQKLTQLPPQQLSNHISLDFNSQSITAQPNLINSTNKSSPNQTTPSQVQIQESLQQQQTYIGSELNLIQAQINQTIQGPILQNNTDKKLQLPNYLSELIQMFNKNSQALGQAVEQITAVSNQQMVLMEKLDIIYEYVNIK